MSTFRLTLSRFFTPLLLAFGAFTLASCDVGPILNTPAQVDPTKPVVVALMVPYDSGQALNDQLAGNLVNAARMAQADLGGIAIDLRVYNTAADPARASAEATRAIAEGAQIIVGPLFSGATNAVGAVAAKKGINVLSFSNNAAVAGGNVYIMGVTYQDIASRLFGYARGQGLANVGVVYPEGTEGEAGLAAAQYAANKTGVTLAATASYPLNMEGLSTIAPTIAETLAANRVQSLLFTDTPTRGLPFIAAALATEGIGPKNTQFLGLTRWDSSTELLTQPSMQGGLFAVPDPDLTAQFTQRYLAAHGTEPHKLAAIAYDAVAAVGALIKTAQAEGSNDTFSAARLTNPNGFVGVNGVFRFTSDGLNERGLAVLKVDKGDAVVVDPAPRSFGGSFGF